MIRIISAAAFFFLMLAQASATCGSQNPNCIVPDRPNGDSTEAAANTKFVTHAVGGATITVGSTPIGAGTPGQVLYDNAGVLGNKSFAITVQRFTSGTSATYTPTAGTANIRVRMCGGGGGGGASNTNGGSAGGTTSFGSWTASGGAAGGAGGGGAGGAGGSGGSNGTGTLINRISGGSGTGGVNLAGSTTQPAGGSGGNNPFGGAGGGGNVLGAGFAAAANSCGGGGGSGLSSGGTSGSGGGGGAGEYVEFFVSGPGNTTYTVGGAGSGGAAGGLAGGSGGAGIIVIEESPF